jgi:hypothetical protein
MLLPQYFKSLELTGYGKSRTVGAEEIRTLLALSHGQYALKCNQRQNMGGEHPIKKFTNQKIHEIKSSVFVSNAVSSRCSVPAPIQITPEAKGR